MQSFRQPRLEDFLYFFFLLLHSVVHTKNSDRNSCAENENGRNPGSSTERINHGVKWARILNLWLAETYRKPPFFGVGKLRTEEVSHSYLRRLHRHSLCSGDTSSVQRSEVKDAESKQTVR